VYLEEKGHLWVFVSLEPFQALPAKTAQKQLPTESIEVHTFCVIVHIRGPHWTSNA
jgi:hypothetical protein